MTSKPACRRLLRKRRNDLSAHYRQWAATAAAEHVSALPGWETVRRVAVYWANDGELDPAGIISHCRQHERELYLPRLTADKQLLFGRWRADQDLLPNHLGIPEPEDDKPLIASELDVVFLPLVGWHRDGTRLGMGVATMTAAWLSPADPCVWAWAMIVRKWRRRTGMPGTWPWIS
ncbi:5-formyltetrahydrofolate cyclo-ligase [Kineobactrum salinum]|uniref:5-formyltetrahydrofolate cyclo-ligase n=1 Tax=Kineobactrum salinum TaxID=2708301 RepID=A0A6C0U509_9GAMM|nr:5-formyltetrahydrofolate cyclo-ligase [Kineobactrum salinum]QIB65485.1 5-formyltetrahydrofolate cyclo-ligase [Kineobactrum salinum]